MKEIIIKSFDELHYNIQKYSIKTTIFRGVKDKAYELIPKIGRLKLKQGERRRIVEKHLITLFKERSLPFLKIFLRNEWEWLFYSQHYGLPTRLLDWTWNPLVASYFAVEDEFDGDSVIYIYNAEGVKRSIINTYSDPFSYKGLPVVIVSSHSSDRIIAQVGIFTIHPNPEESFESENIIKLIIPVKKRKALKKVLYIYGIHRASLFPGLDDLTKHLTWLKSECY